MKKITLILTYILIFISLSCNTRNEQYYGFKMDQKSESSIKSIIKNQKLSIDDFDKIFIMPGIGCSSCISSAETYFKDKGYKNDKYLFIFTGITDIKMFYDRIPKEKIGKNCVIDIDNQMMNRGSITVYPNEVEIKKDGVYYFKKDFSNEK